MPITTRGGIRRLVLVISLVLIASACGGNDSPTGESTDVSDSTSTSVAGDVEEGEAAPATDDPEPDQTFALENGPIEPLTGRPLSDEGLLSRRVVAAKIDNDEKARPQLGLDEADIVFEIAVENSITRFLAVFHSIEPSLVGPVRSARSSDLDVLAALSGPFFTYSGSNTIVGQEVRGSEGAGLLIRASFDDVTSAYVDQAERPRPHHRMVDPAKVRAQPLTNEEAEVLPVFRYLDADESPEGLTPVAGLRSVTNARTPVSYVWDKQVGGWHRFQGLTEHLAASGNPVAPTNVVVLEISYKVSRADAASPQAVTTGSGPVTVFMNGGLIEGTWTRDAPQDGFDLSDENGNPIRLWPGQTFVQLVRAGEMTTLADSDAASILALAD
ncbi:MAG: DUF3048 domain-containing protein [Acidimicrobiales bacterium]